MANPSLATHESKKKPANHERRSFSLSSLHVLCLLITQQAFNERKPIEWNYFHTMDECLGGSDTPSILFTPAWRLVSTVSAHAFTQPTQLPVLNFHFPLPRMQKLTITARRGLQWTTKTNAKPGPAKGRHWHRVITNRFTSVHTSKPDFPTFNLAAELGS